MADYLVRLNALCFSLFLCKGLWINLYTFRQFSKVYI